MNSHLAYTNNLKEAPDSEDGLWACSAATPPH